jgi:hypothetical protein
MISDDKIKQIHKSLKRGEPEGEIKESLVREGYSQEDIDKVFAPRPYDMRSWYLLFACIFLFGGIWMWDRNGGLRILGLSTLLFALYYRETQRLKK